MRRSVRGHCACYSAKSRTPGNKSSRPVSRVLYGRRREAPTWRPFLSNRARTRSLATNPDGGVEPLPRLPGACRPYSVLLPVGFALPSPLPETRCALTAPFHPYRGNPGGILSVALSLGSPPAAVSRHRLSMEPGLSSIPARGQRPPGRLDGCRMRQIMRCVNVGIFLTRYRHFKEPTSRMCVIALERSGLP
jgi:hypothetical protein